VVAGIAAGNDAVGILVVPELFGLPDAELLAGLSDAANAYGSFLGQNARLATTEPAGLGASR
jgi:hypothetical protein